jgi:hypothetical protein
MTVCLHASRWPVSPVVTDQNRSRTVRLRERSREPVMRHPYYRDSYGRVYRDRGAGGRQAIPARFFVTALMVLAAIVVLASVVH